MVGKEEKRKIIEVYITENTEEDTVTFHFEKTEDSKVADNIMQFLAVIIAGQKDTGDQLEIESELGHLSL